jgi:hypothetical protein
MAVSVKANEFSPLSLGYSSNSRLIILFFSFSFLLSTGDDMVPRATAASLDRLEKRLLDYVSDGGGGGIYFDYAK